MASSEKSNKENLHEYVNKRYWMIFQRDTAILSSTCRQLALGIGSVSIFGHLDIIKHHNYLFAILICIVVLFFIADGAQYLNSSLRFKALAQRYDSEIETGESTDISQLEEKQNMNLLSNFFFITKIALLVTAAILFLYLLIISIS